jgi:hypothetical protein
MMIRAEAVWRLPRSTDRPVGLDFVFYYIVNCAIPLGRALLSDGHLSTDGGTLLRVRAAFASLQCVFDIFIRQHELAFGDQEWTN